MAKLTTTDPVNHLRKLGRGAAQRYAERASRVWVPSGLKPLDKIIVGAVGGEVTLIASPPSYGKTALAMQWITTAAQNGLDAAILSMEMPEDGLLNRLVGGLTGIDSEVLLTGKWKDAAQLKLAQQAADYLDSIPMFIDDRGNVDGGKAYEAIRSWKAAGIGVGVIDYLQLMSGMGENRVTQVGDAIRAIKAGAKETGLPIIVVSSTNRSASNRESSKPRMSDLRDSGDIEFAADTIIMMHYPNEDENDNLRLCDLYVLKHRNGPTGIASVKFNKPATRFEEM